MISQTVEYALRAIVTIAQHDGTPCTAQQISKITQVPAPYLSKLMQGLVRASLVTSKRGLHGGFVLAKDPANISIWDVADVVEPIQRIHECPLGIRAHGGTLCPLHRRLDNAMQQVEATFMATSIAEVLSTSGGVTPLCETQKMASISLANVSKKKAAPKTKSKKTSAGSRTKKTSKNS